jgi:negative regulator of sigma E activity
MSRIEDELRTALRREEPSTDFTERVMARIAATAVEMKQEKSREKISWVQRLAELFQPFQMKLAVAVAVACILIFVAVGVSLYRHHQRAIAEIAEGERAKEQVMLAMKIASAKLNVAQKKVQKNSEK